MTPADRIADLRARIHHHEERYYVFNDPEVSDAEFDALMKELEALEAEYPDLATEDSPTRRVGGRPVEGFDTVQHHVPMLSSRELVQRGGTGARSTSACAGASRTRAWRWTRSPTSRS